MNSVEPSDEGEDYIVAMIADDVDEMLKKSHINHRELLQYESKWRRAGASSESCKLARLLAAKRSSLQEGRGDFLREFANACQLYREISVESRPGVPALEAPTSATQRAGHALIMKGGGIKGLAYVGAIEHLSRHYSFNWYVGTSAGAVAAVLLGAGYTVDQLKKILSEKNFKDFFDAPWWKWAINLPLHHGLHPANTFTEWLDTLLAEKLRKPSRVKLSDLPHRVTVYASRRNKQAVRYDSLDNDADAAYAVRCSMSIPIIFVPQSDQGLRTYDGGLQHNFPVSDLLAHHAGTPFVSLYLGSEVYEPVRQRWVLSDLLSIWTEAGDAEAVTKYRDRTVIIDPRPIGTLDFDLTDSEKEYLLTCGRVGALGHLADESEDCKEARRERGELRSQVERARRTKRAKRRARICLAFLAVYLLLVLLGWRYFLRPGRPSDVAAHRTGSPG